MPCKNSILFILGNSYQLFNLRFLESKSSFWQKTHKNLHKKQQKTQPHNNTLKNVPTIWLNQRHQHRGGSLCNERGPCGVESEPWTRVLDPPPSLPPAPCVSWLNHLPLSFPHLLYQGGSWQWLRRDSWWIVGDTVKPVELLAITYFQIA